MYFIIIKITIILMFNFSKIYKGYIYIYVYSRQMYTRKHVFIRTSDILVTINNCPY